MKIINVAFFMIFLLIFSMSSWGNDNYKNSSKLEKVFAFGRHGIRTPLFNDIFEKVTNKEWPKWNTPNGYLTTKGGVVEAYMGSYLRDWLASQGILNKNSCPNLDDILVYANSYQRTVATAQYLVDGAFPGCEIKVKYQRKIGEMDPVFNSSLSKKDKIFINKNLKSLKHELTKINLNYSYALLDKILDYKNSPNCQKRNKCSLVSESNKNSFSLKKGEEPHIKGILNTGTALIDAFIMEYYEGFPKEKVAWGEIENFKEWKKLSEIMDNNQNLLSFSGTLGKNRAYPLLNFIREGIDSSKKSKNKFPKITFMIGHDSNIATLLSALKINHYQLPGQFESTPISGLVLFEKWYDKKNDKNLLKIEYIYQTTEQIRNANKLSLKYPPRRIKLEMKNCSADREGYCSWNRFKNILSQYK